jgi:hypothetical protein
MRRDIRLLPLAILLLVTASACARPVDFDVDPQQTQALNVINDMPHPMMVWFDDGTGERLLGTVAAGSRDRFIIAGATATTVSVVARDQGGTHTVRRTVSLVPGGTVDVRLN